MKRNQRNAYKVLKGLGVPVYEGGWNGDEDTFRISAEDNHDTIWADYYMMTDGGGYEFGVHPVINKTLAKYGLFAEWCNPGVLDVYEN
jgi:hypothetical protein